MDALSQVDYAIISQALLAAAREMGEKLVRSAYSTILRETRDGSAAIFDAQGRAVAQAELVAVHLGGMSAALKPCMEQFPPVDLQPGDFYITNHPFAGGQHLQDILMFSPIFHSNRLIGFAGTVAHHLDLGGGKPGLDTASIDVHQEGFIIPPNKLNWERDWKGGTFRRVLLANVRVPQKTAGDLEAQLAANAVGAERVGQLCGRYGFGRVGAAMDALLAYGEKAMRQAIASVPDGVYVGEEFVHDERAGSEPLRIRATVTVCGDALKVDFGGTSDQVPFSINSPFASTIAAAISCVKGVLTTPDIPVNDGSVRAVEISAPLGSLLNPRPPAPVRTRMVTCYPAYTAVMSALVHAVPEKAIAPGFNATAALCLSCHGETGYRVYLEVFGGGFGASAHADGSDGISGPLSNCSNTPIEALDMEYDFFELLEYALECDSGGHGRYRGGLGLRRRYRILREGVSLAMYSGRLEKGANGILNGQPGAMARCEIWRGGKLAAANAAAIGPLRDGDEVVFVTGGGGGYGDPRSRDRSLIERDLHEAFFSPDRVCEAYDFADSSGSGLAATASGLTRIAGS